MRLFVAAEISDEQREALTRLIRSASDARARWVRPENLHITLRFLGEQSSERLDALQFALLRAAARISAFDFSLASIGSFGQPARPRVLFCGVRDDRQFEHVAAILNEEFQREGLAPDDRFHAHITLAREPSPAALTAIARETVPNLTACVSELVLFESRPGSAYAVVRRAALGSRPA